LRPSLEKTITTTKEGLKYRNYLDSDNIKRRRYLFNCSNCGVDCWVQKSKLEVQKVCKACVNKQGVSQEVRDKISKTLINKYQVDPVFKEKVFKARNVASGSDHWNWKGGVTPLNQKTRTSEDCNAWKLAVLHRDNYSCRMCGSKENLQAHHINSWAAFPEDRFILQNGLTMCKECHNFYHKYESEIRRNEN